uniref:Uncharacterized protein n=1 Tax=Lotus japonicus TaxID=34305 RepID=I3SMN2_LOTJA|nr:unknown [Lotus japonicus]
MSSSSSSSSTLESLLSSLTFSPGSLSLVFLALFLDPSSRSVFLFEPKPEAFDDKDFFESLGAFFSSTFLNNVDIVA